MRENRTVERRCTLRVFGALLLLMLLGAALAACRRSDQQSSVDSPWRPNWQTVPDKTKKAKPQLSPTITFTDALLDFVPDNDTEQQKKLTEEDTANKEAFLRAFRQIPECKDFTFMLSNPHNADFDVQVFEGLDGRTGRWQWVLYRTDITERLAYGEETDAESTARRVCAAVRGTVTPAGGRVK